MAPADDSSSNHRPTVSTGLPGENSNSSPKFRRSNLTSPWAQIVRGGETEESARHSPPSSSSSSSLSTPAVSLPEQNPSSDCSPSMTSLSSPPLPQPDTLTESSDPNNGNAAVQPKQSAWNKSSNGIAEVSPEIDVVSWPPLSESARASPKLPSVSPKLATDGSTSTSQVQGPANAHSSQRQASIDTKSSSSSNHTMPTRPRPTRRSGSSGSGVARGIFAHHSTPSQPPFPPVFPIPLNSFGSPAPAPAPAPAPVVPDPSLRETPFLNDSNWDNRAAAGGFMPQPQSQPQPHPVNNYHNSQQRRGHFGAHPRGDSSYHHNNYRGGRRDQDRGGNYGSVRDARVQQQRPPPRGFVRPPPPPFAAPFAPPQLGGTFVNPMGFHEFMYVPAMPFEAYRDMPFIAPPPPPPVYFPPADPNLPALIVKQMEYYFSNGNLVKDQFLRKLMDDQGWVEISKVAEFPRMKSLTDKIQVIKDALRMSSVVEMQGNKVRRRNDWERWVQQSFTQSGAEPGTTLGGENHNELVNSLSRISVWEGGSSSSSQNGNPNRISEVDPEGSCLEEYVEDHSHLPNGDSQS